MILVQMKYWLLKVERHRTTESTSVQYVIYFIDNIVLSCGLSPVRIGGCLREPCVLDKNNKGDSALTERFIFNASLARRETECLFW